MSKLIMCTLLAVVTLALVASPELARADVCLMAYTTGPCEYHYALEDFYTVGPGHELYDPAYDRGGEVLIKALEPEIALDVYQAVGLTGFVHDEVDQGYFAIGSAYDLIVDGYNKTPTTFTNILLVFDGITPEGCTPLITVDGNPVSFDAGLGYYYPLGDLVVSTPAPVGNSYSDVITVSIDVQLCAGARVWAFSDENFNLMHDLPGECFTAFSHDVTVPTDETSWGQVKSLYQ